MNHRIDLEALSELRDIMEDDFGKLLDQYISVSHELIIEMDADLLRDDREALSRNAHSLKGSSLNLGARSVARRCAVLEEQAKETCSPDSLAALVRGIAEEYQGTVVDLKALR